MTVKPSAHLVMLSGYGRVIWCEVEPDEWQIIAHRPEQYRIFVINGQTACIFVATEDNNLTREDALKTASSFVKGAYKTIHFDLDRCETTETDGTAFVHPPH